MHEAPVIRAALGLDVYPAHLRLPFQTVYDAIGKAQQASLDQVGCFGVELWTALFRAGARNAALDQTIDRLPPMAFGRVPPNGHLTILAKEWATYKAPNIYLAYVMFKMAMLDVGWKPSQVNSHLVVSLRMEEMVFGEPVMAKAPPDFSELDTSDLNAREMRAVDRMRRTAAFA